jgi:hypothetical protein
MNRESVPSSQLNIAERRNTRFSANERYGRIYYALENSRYALFSQFPELVQIPNEQQRQSQPASEISTAPDVPPPFNPMLEAYSNQPEDSREAAQFASQLEQTSDVVGQMQAEQDVVANAEQIVSQADDATGESSESRYDAVTEQANARAKVDDLLAQRDQMAGQRQNDYEGV